MPNRTDRESASTTEADGCGNCGTPLCGPYCHECGQRVDDRLVPVQRLVAQAVEDILQLDLRLVRTLGILAHPGALTIAYLEGRRTRYVPPLRLLLISGFVFLLAVGLEQRVQPGAGGVLIQLDDDAEAALVQRRDSLLQIESTGAKLKAYAAASALRAHREPEQLNRLFLERLSLVAVLLLPIFALILRGLHRNRLYAEHLIVTLHLHAVLFGVFGLALLAAVGTHALGLPAAAATAGLVGVAVAMIGYIWVTLRRVYGEGPLITTLKLAALGSGYGIALVTVFTLYATFTILRV